VTAGEVASATSIARATVASTLGKLAREGELERADLPGGESASVVRVSNLSRPASRRRRFPRRWSTRHLRSTKTLPAKRFRKRGKHRLFIRSEVERSILAGD
jgi:hypothetical protein